MNQNKFSSCPKSAGRIRGPHNQPSRAPLQELNCKKHRQDQWSSHRGTIRMSGANLQTFLRLHNLEINNEQKSLLIQNSVTSNLFSHSTFRFLQFNCFNSNHRMHKILL